MRFTAALLFALCSFPATVFAQMHAPVFKSYLPSITLYDERLTLDFDLVFCKSGGPWKHTEHQMYVLAYLEKDEAKILKLAADKKLTDKRNEKNKLLIDALEEDGLVTTLSMQVAKREETKPEEAKSPRSLIRGDSGFKYSFHYKNNELFKTIGKLKNFDAKNYINSDHRYYEDKFKLMIFVPVNDSKYATKVAPELQKTPDFAHFMDLDTILLYFKPLPYRFQFKPLDKDDEVLIYVD